MTSSRTNPIAGSEGIDLAAKPFRMRVHAKGETQGLSCTGEILSGALRVGDRVRTQPGDAGPFTVRAIFEEGSPVQSAATGRVVGLDLSDGGTANPGDLLTASSAPAVSADQFEATVTCNGANALFAGRKYHLKLGPVTVDATVTEINDVARNEGRERSGVKRLEPGETGFVHLVTSHPIAFDRFQENPVTGQFALVDPTTGLAAGRCELHRILGTASDLHYQGLDITKQARAARMRQKACVIWFTGLSGAGKSTIANLVESRLFQLGHQTYLLDGDNVRHGLNKDLGFSDADRVENIRRIAEVARLLVDAGLIALVSFISPFRSERRMARALVEKDEFIEVFVDTPLAVAEARDPKGLYKKARRGELKNFTGLDSPYEPPENAEIRIETIDQSASLSAELVIAYLRSRGVLAGSGEASAAAVAARAEKS